MYVATHKRLHRRYRAHAMTLGVDSPPTPYRQPTKPIPKNDCFGDGFVLVSDLFIFTDIVDCIVY